MKEPRKLPFDCVLLDAEPVEVQNPYSGEKYTLEPDAVAVYDVIKGAESMGMHKIVQQGLAWFMEYEPKAYMVLLD
jgi:hypothetical protein